MDKLSKARRSENMRRIRSKNTSPELIVRKAVSALGYRFRLHSKKLPGKPDLVFPKLKKAIFVHGCFWHQHKNCIDGRLPKSRLGYWKPKLDKNVLRDRRNRRELKKLGWQTFVVWECQTANPERLPARLNKFLSARRPTSPASW